MRRNCRVIALVGLFFMAGAPVASAQDGFTVTTTDVGPEIGLGGISGAGIGFGGRFEKGFKQLPSLKDGVLGIGIGVDFFSFGNSLQGFGYDWKIIPISVTVNYHYPLENKKVDPFFGAGLGYERVSVSGPSCTIFGVNYCDAAYSSGVYFVGHAGIRYYVQPKLALYADVGSGSGALHVGIMFKIAE